MRSICVLSLSTLLLIALGCDSANPVAPEGTVLTITANPSKIGLSGSSTITVSGRKPDGNPLNRGTEIRLSTTLGTLDPVIAQVDQNGVATATLRADGRSGIATVEATTGDGTVTVTRDVQIGETAETRPTVLVSVNPNNIPVEGTATITVIARNPDGTPVAAGLEVILTTTLGRLTPSRPRIGADGTATARLDAGGQAGTATITAIVGASEPATATVTIRDAATDISVQANPSTVPRANTQTELTAFVTNSQGQPLQGAPVTFDSEVGTLQINGVVFTDTSGVARNTLVIQQQELGNRQSFQVTASTPTGDGTIIEDRTTITVQ